MPINVDSVQIIYDLQLSITEDDKLAKVINEAMQNLVYPLSQWMKRQRIVPRYRSTAHIAKFGKGWHMTSYSPRRPFKVPRRGGDTDELVKSARVIPRLGRRTVIAGWFAEHAQYVSRQSKHFNTHIRHAVTRGTSLDWVLKLQPKIRLYILGYLQQALKTAGYPKSILSIPEGDIQ